MITEAVYKPSSLPIYQGNPLIEALPDYLTYRTPAIREKLRKEPIKLAGQANRRQCFAWLMSLNKALFIELPRHLQLQEMIDVIIRQGYHHRKPIGAERAKALQAAYERLQSGDATAMANFGHDVQDPLSVSVVGCSGIGKTTAITRILSMYPQVLHHPAYRLGAETLQVTYLKVECPHDGSVKSLCTNIIRELDKITGQDYESAYIKSRSTLETIKSRMIHLMAVHYVGLLVIDEIQNLTVNKKNKNELFNFIVSLANTLAVPILYVGTPKIIEFMTSDLRIGRRFGSIGAIRWNHLSRNAKEWDYLISKLWEFNVFKSPSRVMPEEIEAAFYEYSQGIIDVLIKLFILTQMDALVRNLKGFEVERIRAVYETYFQSVDPMITALRKNDVLALEKYQDIAMVNKDYNNALDAMADELLNATADESTGDIPGETPGPSYQMLFERLGIALTPELEQALNDPGENLDELLGRAMRLHFADDRQEETHPREKQSQTTEVKAAQGNLV